MTWIYLDGVDYLRRSQKLGLTFSGEPSGQVLHLGFGKPLSQADLRAAPKKTGCEDFGKIEPTEEITPALR